MTGAPGHGDAGESLLELLISIMIIGVAVTAVLGAVLLVVDASSLDRRQVHAQALLQSWGEHVVGQTTDATYTACATTATYDPPEGSSVWSYPRPTTPARLEALPTGFTPTSPGSSTGTGRPSSLRTAGWTPASSASS